MIDNLNSISTKVAVFATKAAADKAVADLRELGYREDQIGLVATDESGKVTKTGAAGTVGVGISLGAVSVLSPQLTVGTVCTATLGADGGATHATLAGTLIDWSVPREDAVFYEQQVHAGRCLVTVNCGDRTDVAVVFARHGGFNRATAQAVSS